MVRINTRISYSCTVSHSKTLHIAKRQDIVKARYSAALLYDLYYQNGKNSGKTPIITSIIIS